MWYNVYLEILKDEFNSKSWQDGLFHGTKWRENYQCSCVWSRIIVLTLTYVKRWLYIWKACKNSLIKREVDQDPELDSLSDWVRTIRSLVQGRIHKLKNYVNSRPKSVFKDQEAVKCLSSLHDKYVIVPKLPTISCLYVNHITSNA